MGVVTRGGKLMPADNMVVVLGCPRSGTTFVMKVFHALPNVVALSGLVFPPTIPQFSTRVDDRTRGLLADSFRQSVTHYVTSAAHTARAPGIQKWLRSGRSLSQLRRALRKQPEWDTVVFKEPFLSFDPALVREALPGVRIIHMVRDGRDCADSLVRTYDVLKDEDLERGDGVEVSVRRSWKGRFVPTWLPEGDEEAFLSASPYVRSVYMWREMVTRNETARKQAHQAGEPFLEIRYEDLMSHPEETFEQIAGFSGLTLNASARRILASSHTRSIGIHQRRDSREAHQATAVAEDLLRRYGYDV